MYKRIMVHRSQGDALSSQLVALYKTLQGLSPQELVEFDFSNLTWTHPLLILPFASYIHRSGSRFISPPPPLASYFSTLQFPNGARTVGAFQQSKNYIPIGFLTRHDPINRDKIESAFLHLLNTTIQAVPQSQNAIYYPINELITNIFDHSQRDEGWILAQWYPHKQFLDLCIIDSGRGLKQGYQEEMQLTLTDAQAIQKAMGGISTKKDKERGFGLRTSKDIVCKALAGSFLILSGNAALISEGSRERIVQLPQFNWQGVIVSYRIPKPTNAVDITPYLE